MNNAVFAARVRALVPAPVCGHPAARVRQGLCPPCYARAWRAEQRATRADLAEAGWSVADVAGAFGLPIIVVLHWIWNGALVATRAGDRYAVGDGALHAFLWRYPAAWQGAPLRDRAWVEGLLWDADLCKSATEPADVRALRKAATPERRAA